MTDIVNLQAGHELDVLVADKVMGWTDWRTWGPGQPAIKAPGENSRPFSPSTDIRDAIEVVEKIGKGLTLHWDPEEKTLNYFRDDQDLSEETRNAYAGTGSWVAGIGGLPLTRAKTAPLAICGAALKTVDHR